MDQRGASFSRVGNAGARADAQPLSREEQVAFVSALLTLSERGARLKKAVQSYRQKAGL